MQDRRTATQRDYEERILRVLVHIQEHLDGKLELDALAAVACFSPFHFHRVFCGIVGEPVKAHVRRLRLERAAQRLKRGDETITQLALGAGYETPESFARAFRTRFGVSPRDFRQAHTHVDPSDVPSDASARFQPVEPRAPMDASDARVETHATTQVAFVRHTGPYNEIGSAWQRVYSWAGMRGHLGPRTKAFGMAYDDPDVTPAERLRYDACLSVSTEATPEGDVGTRSVKRWTYAVMTHVGSYSRLGETYAKLLGRWMPSEDLEPAPDLPCIEFYLNNPQSTPEDELVTEVCVPIQRGAIA